MGQDDPTQGNENDELQSLHDTMSNVTAHLNQALSSGDNDKAMRMHQLLSRLTPIADEKIKTLQETQTQIPGTQNGGPTGIEGQGSDGSQFLKLVQPQEKKFNPMDIFGKYGLQPETSKVSNPTPQNSTQDQKTESQESDASSRGMPFAPGAWPSSFTPGYRPNDKPVQNATMGDFLKNAFGAAGESLAKATGNQPTQAPQGPKATPPAPTQASNQQLPNPGQEAPETQASRPLPENNPNSAQGWADTQDPEVKPTVDAIKAVLPPDKFAEFDARVKHELGEKPDFISGKFLLALLLGGPHLAFNQAQSDQDQYQRAKEAIGAQVQQKGLMHQDRQAQLQINQQKADAYTARAAAMMASSDQKQRQAGYELEAKLIDNERSTAAQMVLGAPDVAKAQLDHAQKRDKALQQKMAAENGQQSPNGAR